MAGLRFKYLISDKDRHGNERWYVRAPGQKKVRIREAPGSEEFMVAYHAAVRGHLPVKAQTVKPQSLAWLINNYYGSNDFHSAAKATQIQRRSILNRISREHGDRDCRTLTQAAVKAGRDARAATPGAANNMIKVIKSLYAWGIEAGHVEHNPAEGVKRLKLGQSTWRSWDVEECLAFEEAHPIGSTARTVYSLALYGGLRRSDIAQAGRQHRKAGRFAMQQKKTGNWVSFVEPPQLAEALDAAPITGMHFAETEYGKPFSEKGLGARFKKWCRDAGLADDLSLHGLRKALGARLAEAGATQEQIAAALGHSGTRTAEVYTKGAEKRRLADAAFAKLNRTDETQSVPPGASKVSHRDKS